MNDATAKIWSWKIICAKFGGEALDQDDLLEPFDLDGHWHIIIDDDVIGKALPNAQIGALFGIMASCPQHTFFLSTHNMAALQDWFCWLDTQRDRWRGKHPCDWRVHAVAQFAYEWTGWEGEIGPLPEAWPLPNVFLGLRAADPRVIGDRLRSSLQVVPARGRFLCLDRPGQDLLRNDDPPAALGIPDRSEIDGVIASLATDRPPSAADIAWIRTLRDRCTAVDVPFFFRRAVGDPAETCEQCQEWVRCHVAGPGDALYSCGCTQEGPEPGSAPAIGAGDHSLHKRFGVIEFPYLDGVQHVAFPVPAHRQQTSEDSSCSAES